LTNKIWCYEPVPGVFPLAVQTGSLQGNHAMQTYLEALMDLSKRAPAFGERSPSSVAIRYPRVPSWFAMRRPSRRASRPMPSLMLAGGVFEKFSRRQFSPPPVAKNGAPGT